MHVYLELSRCYKWICRVCNILVLQEFGYKPKRHFDLSTELGVKSGKLKNYFKSPTYNNSPITVEIFHLGPKWGFDILSKNIWYFVWALWGIWLCRTIHYSIIDQVSQWYVILAHWLYSNQSELSPTFVTIQVSSMIIIIFVLW